MVVDLEYEFWYNSSNKKSKIIEGMENGEKKMIKIKLKIHAEDNHGSFYEVFIEKGIQKFNPSGNTIIRIDGTPANAHLDSLVNGDWFDWTTDKPRNDWYIDSREGWKVINLQEILTEALTV